MIKSQQSAIECGAIEDHHSDSGYGSSTSPYSSIHHSPLSDHGNGAGETQTEASVPRSESGQFPTNVFQEVANTVNGSMGNDEMIQILKDLDQPGSNLLVSTQNVNTSSNQTVMSSANNSHVLSKGMSSSSTSLKQDFTAGQRKCSDQQILQSLPAPSFTSQPSMRRNASTGDIQQVPYRILTGNFQQARVSSVQHIPPQGSLGDLDSLYLVNPTTTASQALSPEMSALSPQMNTLSPQMNTLSPQTISDDSNGGMDYMSQDALSDAMISDVNLAPQGYGSPESLSGQSVPAGGQMNIQIGALNNMDLDSIGGDLPKEITDFCIEYCESLAESQAQQLMSTFGQGELMELGQLTTHTDTASNKAFSPDVPMNQCISSPENVALSTPSMTSAAGFTAMNTVPAMSGSTQQNQVFNFPITTAENFSQQNISIGALPSQYPLQPNRGLVVPGNPPISPCNMPYQMQAQNAVQMQSQSAMQAQSQNALNTQNAWTTAPATIPADSILRSLMSPPVGVTPLSTPRSPYNKSQYSPQSGSVLSPSQPANSPFSPAVTPQSPGINPLSPAVTVAHSYQLTSIPHGSNGITRQSVYPGSQIHNNQNLSSCSDCISSQSRTITSVAHGNQLRRALTQNPAASTGRFCTSSQVMNNCCSAVSASLQSNTQNMSELEKMLRGYSRPNGLLASTQKVSGDQANNTQTSNLSGCGPPPLLQQMLTGQLSGEMYHAMENRRKLKSPAHKSH